MKKGSLWGRTLAVSVMVLCLGFPAIAKESGVEDPEHEAESHVAGEAAEHEEHEFHRHHLSVFLGATTADVEVHGGEGEVGTESEGGETGGETERTTEASIGLDYEYRLNRMWGVGFLFDYVGGDARASVAAIPVFLHPAGGLKLLTAPGVEHHEGENEFLVRLGLGYQFDVGRWAITPGASVDFVDGDQVYIYGIYLSRGF